MLARRVDFGAWSPTQRLRHLYPSGEEVVERVVDGHIGKLRGKLGAVSDRPWIQTIRGTGYRMAEESELDSGWSAGQGQADEDFRD